VVEAENPELALELLKHQLGDHSGVRNHVYSQPGEYKAPESNERVVSCWSRPWTVSAAAAPNLGAVRVPARCSKR
jgi:hypothetical protein